MASGVSHLERLLYTVGLIDKFSGPAGKIVSKIESMTAMGSRARDVMTEGATTAAAGYLALYKTIGKAIDQKAALGEVQSLGVDDESLSMLNKTAINATNTLGGASQDFTRAAYDIQSAIAGLNAAELSGFTAATYTGATATKANIGDMTAYMGTMYSIWKDYADKMGKNQWVEYTVEMTAKAVRAFKTDGKKMSDAWSAVGNDPQMIGFQQADIMTGLGVLSATQEGSVAGTSFGEYSRNLLKAGDALDLALFDDNGRAIPLIEQLDIFKQRFGDLKEDSAQKMAAIEKAFGSKPAASALKGMLNSIEQVRQNAGMLAENTGMETVNEMAQAISSPWDRIAASASNVSITFGAAVLPVIEPVVDGVATLLGYIAVLAADHQILAGIVGTVIIGFITLITVYNAAKVAITLYKIATAGLNLTLSLSAIKTYALAVAKLALHAVILTLKSAIIAVRGVWWLYKITLIGVNAVMASSAIKTYGLIAAHYAARGAMLLLSGALTVVRGAVWLFNAALMANPIGLVVGAVALLVAGVAALVVYWDEAKAALMDIGPINMLVNGIKNAVAWAEKMAKWLGIIDGKHAAVNVEQTNVTKDSQITALSSADSISHASGRPNLPTLATANQRVSNVEQLSTSAKNKSLESATTTANERVNNVVQLSTSAKNKSLESTTTAANQRVSNIVQLNNSAKNQALESTTTTANQRVSNVERLNSSAKNQLLESLTEQSNKNEKNERYSTSDYIKNRAQAAKMEIKNERAESSSSTTNNSTDNSQSNQMYVDQLIVKADDPESLVNQMLDLVG